MHARRRAQDQADGNWNGTVPKEAITRGKINNAIKDQEMNIPSDAFFVREDDNPYPGHVVVCYDCGRVTLTVRQYDIAMNHANSRWTCPKCGGPAEWDDDAYEKWIEEQEDKIRQKNEWVDVEPPPHKDDF